MSRSCPAPLAGFQPLLDFGRYFTENGQKCFGSRHSSDETSSGLQMVWDACFPAYHPTSVAVLEKRREDMAMALVGQLTVVCCRILTGHIGGGAVGLIVFIVGNNARCSLQASNLTCYVALGFTAGALDAFDLLQRVIAGQLHFLLPFTANMAEDLFSISTLLAPVCEFSGASVAWNSYPSASMLFESQSAFPMASMYPSMPAHFYMATPHGPFGTMPPGMTMPYPASDPMRTRMPTSEGWARDSMASMFAGWPGFGGFGDSVPMLMQPQNDPELTGRDWEGWQPRRRMSSGSYGIQAPTASSSSDRTSHASPPKPHSNSVAVECEECSDLVEAQMGRLGTGSYYGKVYCQDCWSAWAANSPPQWTTGASE
eukprot:TRINITY_DN30739_c0_g1_i2.p1 TRINITY_DN30739_c0_g1~~TRINITY_DN30739_c0_g1_i2.p1  ORF type:complete len:380 (-),score=50.65 TRINITY_DN30739_c0_g1_i2:16-1128(-)